jgi:hypothetical protein
MMQENVGAYYATTTGVPATTLTEVNIATARVTGAGKFNCTYDLKITPSSTSAASNMYTAFTGMTGHDAGQIVLKVGSHTYDFNTTDFSGPVTINESFSNLTSSASQNIKASLMFNNTTFDQNALQGKDITFTFSATNFSCSAVDAPAVPAFTAPTIGNFIHFDDDASGIYYRVLYNETGSTYLVLRMNNDLGDVKYNDANATEYQKYAGSTLDTYMNSTFYNTLSTNIKNAIVDKSINQKAYEWKSDTSAKTKGDTTYTYQFENNWGGDSNYAVANYVSKVNVGTRHVYALEIDDIYKYMSALKGSTERVITSTELNNMFFNTSGNTTVKHYPWLLRSARNSSNAWYVSGNKGFLYVRDVTSTEGVRPAFLVDLSKVDFEEIASTEITTATLGNS